MGLLWPVLMGRFGAAFGIPFAVEGLFFFLEAISSRSTPTAGAACRRERIS